MGYLKFDKGSGEVDLLPADNILHVGTAGATSVVLKMDTINAGFDTVTITYVEIATAEEIALVRGAINDAIEVAGGAQSTAIKVKLPTLVSTIGFA